MSDKEKKLEQIIEQTLLEAKKKARMKAHSKSHDEEGEEKEEDTVKMKKMKKIKEAKEENNDDHKVVKTEVTAKHGMANFIAHHKDGNKTHYMYVYSEDDPTIKLDGKAKSEDHKNAGEDAVNNHLNNMDNKMFKNLAMSKETDVKQHLGEDIEKSSKVHKTEMNYSRPEDPEDEESDGTYHGVVHFMDGTTHEFETGENSDKISFYPKLSKEKNYEATDAVENHLNNLPHYKNFKRHEMIHNDKVEESTQAAESLKPSSRPKDEPKSVVMGNMMKMAGGMSKDDLNKFAATMAQFGPGKDYGVGDKSASNQATIDMKTGKGPKTKDAMPKLNVKEDIDEMFVGEDLSEEFKEKASTLFEAAISARLSVEVAKLEEAYQETIAEELEVFTEEITDKLDAYLDYVVENWMAENEVAIESTLRNEIMEEFIDGLKGLFSEHYIEVPESKVDVVESLAEKVNELEETLDNVITENSEMKEIISDVAMREIFEELSSDLALTQQEKFASLAEGIEFDGDIDVYTKKLRIIKETYFNNEQVSSNLEEETFEGDNPSVVSTNPVVNKYVQALSRTVKK